LAKQVQIFIPMPLTGAFNKNGSGNMSFKDK